jgi:hypothetical protein
MWTQWDDVRLSELLSIEMGRRWQRDTANEIANQLMFREWLDGGTIVDKRTLAEPR